MQLSQKLKIRYTLVILKIKIHSIYPMQVDFMMNIEQFIPWRSFKEVKRIEWVESCNKFFKRVLWDDDEESEDTPKNNREVYNNELLN